MAITRIEKVALVKALAPAHKAKLRKHLKELGFESEDFFITNKKNYHFLGWKYNMYNRY